jgi:DeoR family glycerol-3-phosphate regulon repressor
MDDTSRHKPQQPSGRLIGRVRKERIARMIRERGFMSSAALAEAFGVSEMTARRDLAELEARGLVQRTHGGAVSGPETAGVEAPREPFFDERRQHNHEAKSRIARAAAGLVRPMQAVALDVGTTTYALARLLAPREGLRIVTSNLRVAALCQPGGAEVYALGGRVRPKEMSLCGPIAVEQARKLWFDVAFIGVSAVSESGIFDYAVEETEMKQVLAERATRRIVLADSSKFGGRSLVAIGGLDSLDVLVTDAVPPAALAAALDAAGVEVLVAGA